MRRKYRYLAGLLGLLLLFGALLSLPALATEGTYPEEPGTYPTEAPPPVVEPTQAPPVTEPTPPPSTEPIPEPTPPPLDTPEPQPSEDPGYAEPTEEPWYPEEPAPTPEPSTEDPAAGWGTEPTATPRPTASPTPRPAASATPRASTPPSASLDRPKTTPRPSTDSQGEDSASQEPDYRTFARLNQRTNSMSITLFYTGAACVALGAAGLITLLVLFLRNRRRNQRDRLIEEIELAETRPAPQGYPIPGTAGERQAPPRQPAPRRESGAQPILPVEASLYTEEFTLPQAPAKPAPPPEPAPEKAPPQARQPAQSPQSFDTDEILREVLGQIDESLDDQKKT